MASGTRCFVCRSPVDPATETRYGRVRRSRADADVPERFVVCGACRPAVTDLTRHWTQRPSSSTPCSFCDAAADADDLTQFDLESVGLDGRVTSEGTYLLCPACVGVFETFLSDVRADAHPPDPPDPWRVTQDDDVDVYERDSSSLRVVVAPDDGFAVRVRRRADAPATSLVVADDYAAATAHAVEFLAAVEEAAGGDDPERAVADVLGDPLDG